MAIHPTAVVAPGAEIDPSCEIGPYAVIGPKVRMGRENVVGAHAVVDGCTTMGSRNRIFAHAVVGAPPQDLKYRGEDTRLEMGDGNLVREFASIHTGTVGGGGVTRLANQCLIMASAHVAHDVQLGDGCILANCASLAGHVVVEDHVIFGGLTAAHQQTRVGRFAFISGMSGVGMDVAPYCTVAGSRGELAGLNTVGLQRAGMSDEQIGRIKEAYRMVFRSKLPVAEALAQVKAEMGSHPEIAHFVAFCEASKRGLMR